MLFRPFCECMCSFKNIVFLYALIKTTLVGAKTSLLALPYRSRICFYYRSFWSTKLWSEFYLLRSKSTQSESLGMPIGVDVSRVGENCWDRVPSNRRNPDRPGSSILRKLMEYCFMTGLMKAVMPHMQNRSLRVSEGFWALFWAKICT